MKDHQRHFVYKISVQSKPHIQTKTKKIYLDNFVKLTAKIKASHMYPRLYSKPNPCSPLLFCNSSIVLVRFSFTLTPFSINFLSFLNTLLHTYLANVSTFLSPRCDLSMLCLHIFHTMHFSFYLAISCTVGEVATWCCKYFEYWQNISFT